MLPPQATEHWTGRSKLIRWQRGNGDLHHDSKAHNFPPKAVLGKTGVAIQRMRDLSVTLYNGEVFGDTVAPLVLNGAADEGLLPAVWACCSSEGFRTEVRKLTQKVNTTPGTLNKVHFDQAHWRSIAEQSFPNGLPKPYSNDPTQWIFHGHPYGSVVWDEQQKKLGQDPLRTDATVLNIAVARLLGYHWPVENDSAMELADEARAWVEKTKALYPFDDDGIVCLPSVRGEPAAHERLLHLLEAAWGDGWNDGVLSKLLTDAGSNSLDDWLRNAFFEQHCKLFQHRPFIWHIWDGRKRDGFHALVNYHKLAEGDGKGRRLLESLTYSYLGDWIGRQHDGVKRGEGGAEDRLPAALELQKRLVAILEGEPPFDLFVRWKPIEEQPLGWEPDINDGVRLNIRPFMAQDIPGGKTGAGILRAKPNIHWKKDRGKEPVREQSQHPWFWQDGKFTGERVNDVHLTLAEKRAAREATRAGANKYGSAK